MDAGFAPAASREKLRKLFLKGPAYDVAYCCKEICDPVTQPSPQWGVKNGQCLHSMVLVWPWPLCHSAYAAGELNQAGRIPFGGLPCSGEALGWVVERLCALGVRHAGPAASIDAEQAKAVIVRFAPLAIPHPGCPYRAALPAVTEPIAAFAVLRAGAVGHVLGPGSKRAIIRDALVERR